MAQIKFASGFYTDAETITSKRVQENVKASIRAIAMFPLSGSPMLPTSLALKYGSTARKVVIPPFDLIYEFNEAADEITVLGLIHFRQAE